MGICDMHSHLLPEIDDGYLSREQFIRMLNLYQLSGVTAIAFTPHIFNPYVTTNISELRETYQWARGEAEALGLQTYLGSELFVGDQETLKTIPINGRFALVEFGLSLPPPKVLERLQQLVQMHYRPLIAHVERYLWLSPKSTMLQRLRSLGCLLQTNVEAVENNLSLPYLELGLIDVIATDNHGDETLPARLMDALEKWPSVGRSMQNLW
ncbi:CpsB/CapC family capsule biosynthesis tyrosine phosphatase [Sphaerochaeta halotolerans]|jgi:protein-tyrosine phosphatase|uniref:CpsB/CapC family capsule biosynthesis tyrosine phosphatase n=1 Tax=Sphaerochaeta halotolerans TaxID=2293840 RepID=UPI001370489C|nr:CpsB/CapC family capsule biosynthesis tyrosine phosphatase [Sphaerochaeta halotolerans]MDK2860173.1 protein-tyrosine phosphatase [Sphaerochaeta sp.]MXI85721.1 capsule biosynthesis protein CapC [Sphaerochaeta halotolerans]